jgi:hypothetical protein
MHFSKYTTHSIPGIMLREPHQLQTLMLKTQRRIAISNIDIQAGPHYIPILKKEKAIPIRRNRPCPGPWHGVTR